MKLVAGSGRFCLVVVEVPDPTRVAYSTQTTLSLDDVSAIVDALRTGRVPVIAPLAVGPLNVNADDAAAALALGLGARSLVFLTDVAGLYIDDEIVEAIGVGDARRMIAEGAFDGGIVPKLRAAALAAASGITATIGRTAVVA